MPDGSRLSHAPLNTPSSPRKRRRDIGSLGHWLAKGWASLVPSPVLPDPGEETVGDVAAPNAPRVEVGDVKPMEPMKHGEQVDTAALPTAPVMTTRTLGAMPDRSDRADRLGSERETPSAAADDTLAPPSRSASGPTPESSSDGLLADRHNGDGFRSVVPQLASCVSCVSCVFRALQHPQASIQHPLACWLVSWQAQAQAALTRVSQIQQNRRTSAQQMRADAMGWAALSVVGGALWTYLWTLLVTLLLRAGQGVLHWLMVICDWWGHIGNRWAGEPLAFLVVPSADIGGHFASLGSMFQAMTAAGASRQRAIALEIVGTPTMRGLVVRATSPAALLDVEVQLRARYPQAQIVPLTPHGDPFQLGPGERVSLRELRQSGPPFLALDTFAERLGGRMSIGTSARGSGFAGGSAPAPAGELADPLIGLLAAVDHLPPATRAIAQLALVPAAESWSAGAEREADRYSLNQARVEAARRERQLAGIRSLGSAGLPPSWPLLLMGTVAVAGFLWLWHRARYGGPTPWSWMPATWWRWLGTFNPLAPLSTNSPMPAGGSAAGNGGSGMGTAAPTAPPTIAPTQTRPIAHVTPTPGSQAVLSPPALPDFTSLSAHVAALALLLVVALVVLLIAGICLVRWLAIARTRPPLSWFLHPKPVYDPAMVARKAQEPAFHAHLRLYVIGAIGATPAERRHARQQRERQLLRMIAAYRQYHVAGRGYFTVRRPFRSPARWLPRHAVAAPAERSGHASAQPPSPRTLAPFAPPALLSLLPPMQERDILVLRSRWSEQADSGEQGSAEGVIRQRNGWARGLWRAPLLLSISEVAALWHLPAGGVLPNLPGLRNQEAARRLLVPPVLVAKVPGLPVPDFPVPDLPAPAQTAQYEPAERALRLPGGRLGVWGTLLGHSRAAGRDLPVLAPPDLFAQHVLAVAKTGKGKSTLLQTLAYLALCGAGTAALAAPHDGMRTTLRAALPADGSREGTEEPAFSYGALPVKRRRRRRADRAIASDAAQMTLASAATPVPAVQIASAGSRDLERDGETPAQDEQTQPRAAVTDRTRRRKPRHSLPPLDMLQPANEATGLVLVDPHGDLVSGLLGLIPPARQRDVIVVDLADTAHPIGLNPLDVTLGRDRDKAVANILLIASHIWTKYWGPRMENALEYALKTLYEVNLALVIADPQRGPDLQYTLLDVAPLLQRTTFRNRLLEQVRDQELLRWWSDYYEQLDSRM